MSDWLAKKILTTVTYYDVLDYPLTSFEIWRYLITKDYLSCELENEGSSSSCTLTEVVTCLMEDEKLKSKMETKNGFYFLRGRSALVRERIRRNKLAQEKYAIVRRVVCFLRFVPFVRMIGVTGRLAMKNTEKKSDLDFFVCLEAGHIFVGRTLVTLAVHCLGRRRHHAKIVDRVCLNYFVTTASLEIETKTLFASSEYSFMLPIFGLEYFRKFQTENCAWIREYRGNFVPAEMGNAKLVEDNALARLARQAGEWFFGSLLLEQKLKKWQTKRIADDPRTKKAGSLIVADDCSLVFLPDPQGPKVFEEFAKRLEGLDW